jgi:hypothetical protein
VVEKRTGNTLSLRWAVPGGGPFPMPVEVRIGDELRRVTLPATLTVPADTHVVVDPFARILRRSPAIEAYQAYQAEQRAKK